MTLNLLDIVLIVVVVFSIMIGLLRGFIREILSIACWVLAFWVAFQFRAFGESLFEQYLPEGLRAFAGFITIFIGTLLIASIASALLYRLFTATGITGTDRTLGALFGFLRAVLIVSTLVAFVNITTLPRQQWWRDSALIGYFEPIAEMIVDLLPTNIRGQLRAGGTLIESGRERSEPGAVEPGAGEGEAKSN